MANQDSWIRMHAFPGPANRIEENRDQLVIDVSVSLTTIPKHLGSRFSPNTHQRIVKTFRQPRQAFLSASHDEQHDIIRNVIQGVEAPFPLEYNDITWGCLNLPPEETTSPENLNAIISERLLGIVRRAAEDDEMGFMAIFITKLEKLDPERNQQPCVKKPPLDKSSSKSCTICMESCIEVHDTLHKSSSKSRTIRLHCSHLFHVICISKWLHVTPTCPLCRFRVFADMP